ncbi:MAG: ATP-binding cassette domain-containing protein [Micrococcaceae bacterium]
MLEVKNASLKFGSEYIWKDANFAIEDGKFIAIVGPNGSGKSSLLRAIAGLNPLNSGKIIFDGMRVKDHGEAVSYVPQFTELNRQIPLRGVDFVKLGLYGHHWGLSTRNHERRHKVEIEELLKKLDAYSYADKGVTELSGGQLQRLRVAQALICKPKLLLCDEALASLDVHSQEVIVQTINEQREATNMTVLFISHEMEALEKVIDKELEVANKEVKWV